MAWTNPPTNFALEVVKQSDDLLKKIAGEVLQQVITRSPVMDAEFRASHTVSLNAPDNSYVKSFDVSGATTLNNGAGVISTAKIGGLIYVQTNSPYGVALEDGHSQQARNGVYALTFRYVSEKYK